MLWNTVQASLFIADMTILVVPESTLDAIGWNCATLTTQFSPLLASIRKYWTATDQVQIKWNKSSWFFRACRAPFLHQTAFSHLWPNRSRWRGYSRVLQKALWVWYSTVPMDVLLKHFNWYFESVVLEHSYSLSWCVYFCQKKSRSFLCMYHLELRLTFDPSYRAADWHLQPDILAIVQTPSKISVGCKRLVSKRFGTVYAVASVRL